MAFQFNINAVKVVGTGYVAPVITAVKEKSVAEGAPDVITVEMSEGTLSCDYVSIESAVGILNSVWDEVAQARFDNAHPDGYNGSRIMVSQGQIAYNNVANATNLTQNPDCTVSQFTLGEKSRYLSSDDVKLWADFRLENALVRPGSIFKGRGKKASVSVSV